MAIFIVVTVTSKYIVYFKFRKTPRIYADKGCIYDTLTTVAVDVFLDRAAVIKTCKVHQIHIVFITTIAEGNMSYVSTASHLQYIYVDGSDNEISRCTIRQSIIAYGWQCTMGRLYVSSEKFYSTDLYQSIVHVTLKLNASKEPVCP